MKVKVLSRNPDDYVRETKHDIQRGRCVNVGFQRLKFSININVLLFSYRDNNDTGCSFGLLLLLFIEQRLCAVG